MGVIIERQELVTTSAERLDAVNFANTREVFLNDYGELCWKSIKQDHDVTDVHVFETRQKAVQRAASGTN